MNNVFMQYYFVEIGTSLVVGGCMAGISPWFLYNLFPHFNEKWLL